MFCFKYDMGMAEIFEIVSDNILDAFPTLKTAVYPNFGLSCFIK